MEGPATYQHQELSTTTSMGQKDHGALIMLMPATPYGLWVPLQYIANVWQTIHCSCFHLQPPGADLALAIALDEMPEHGHSPDPQLLQCPAASQQLQAAAMADDPDRQLGERGSLATTCPARVCCLQVLSLPCSNPGLLRRPPDRG